MLFFTISLLQIKKVPNKNYCNLYNTKKINVIFKLSCNLGQFILVDFISDKQKH